MGLNMERKGIAPDPITGQGDSRTLSPAPDRGVPEAPAVAERDKALEEAAGMLRDCGYYTQAGLVLDLRKSTPSSAPVQKEQTTAEVIERAAEAILNFARNMVPLPAYRFIPLHKKREVDAVAEKILSEAGLLRSSLAVPEGERK